MSMTAMSTTVPFTLATPLLEQPSTVRRQAVHQGYLFLPALLDPLSVRRVRTEILHVAARHHLVDEANVELALPRADAFVTEWDESPDYRSYYVDVQKQRRFHALSHHPALLSVLDTLFDEPTLVHPRNICRTVFPGRPEYTTAPHQDHRPIRGSTETWTAWLPLGNCPAELGGLALLPGTHREGVHDVADGTINIEVAASREWHWNPMHCGDVLLFHSLTIHQARDHTKMDELRLSCDFRYQPMSHPVAERSLEPHMRWTTWEEIYAGWPLANDPLKYYWRSSDLDIQPA